MKTSHIHESLLSAVYFSLATTALLLLAQLFYQKLAKSAARMSFEWLLVIVMILVAVMFCIGLANILYGEHGSKMKMQDTVLSVALFIVVSAALLWGLFSLLYVFL